MIETPRLTLRGWRDTDVPPFAAMFRDPDVMRHIGGVPDDPEAAARTVIAAHRRDQDANGHCFWAIERRADGVLLGFCGLRHGGHVETAVPRELEIGWRLRRDAWGHGYAREAAEACFDWAWANTDVPRVAAWTVPANTASWGLMIRLGMTPRPELDFDHPFFPPAHPLSRHRVYTLNRPPHG